MDISYTQHAQTDRLYAWTRSIFPTIGTNSILQADINILRQKLKHVEQQLIRASLAKAKEHDYIKTIKAYDREIDKLKRRLKNTWQDPDPAPRDPGKDDDY